MSQSRLTLKHVAHMNPHYNNPVTQESVRGPNCQLETVVIDYPTGLLVIGRLRAYDKHVSGGNAAFLGRTRARL